MARAVLAVVAGYRGVLRFTPYRGAIAVLELDCWWPIPGRGIPGGRGPRVVSALWPVGRFPGGEW